MPVTPAPTPTPAPTVPASPASTPSHAAFPPPTIPAPVFQYADSKGTVQYDWTLPKTGDGTGSLGVVVVSVTPGGSFNFTPTLSAISGLYFTVLGAVWAAGPRAVINYQVASVGTMQVTLQPALVGASLVVRINSDAPVVASVNISPKFSSATWTFKVPYYDQQPYYYPALDVFVNHYFDWLNSLSGSIFQQHAYYGKLTNGTYNLVQEDLVLSVSRNFSDVLPTPHGTQSRYYSEVAGKLIIDVWSNAFDPITRSIRHLADYGLTNNCIYLIHNWQRSGYDNALPAHWPAQAALGGDPSLRALHQAATDAGCRVGVHENYVDYYPNFDNFTMASVMLSSSGAPQFAWDNIVQSFACKPTWSVKNALPQSPVIHALYNTSASFLDVCSSTVPWYRTDMDATVAGAGVGNAWATAAIALYDFLSASHHGPIFGEGNHHWYWSGTLDGAEAQFGAAGDANPGARAPLFVDFDLLKIHPRQVNHGVGYPGRWVASGEDFDDTAIKDAYRVQVLAFGHAPFTGFQYWYDTAWTLLDSYLLSPVAQRYGVQNATSILYQVGGQWVDANAAIKVNDSFWRVQVQYTNGDVITLNSQTANLAVGAVTLPMYGWVATGANLLAYTALQGSTIADYAEITGSSYYANARNLADFSASGALAQPIVTNFTQTGTGQAVVQMQWRVLEGPAYIASNCFVHFTPPTAANIVFQAGFTPSPATTQWLPGQVITSSFTVNAPAQNGSFAMRLGLYTIFGDRFSLYGYNDGTQRYTVGTLVSVNNGQTLTFTPSPYTPPADPRLNGAGSVVDFGTLKTDGMTSVRQPTPGSWTMWAYPRSRNVYVSLNASVFAAPATVYCDSVSQTPQVVDGAWVVPVNGAKTCTWSVVVPTTVAAAATSAAATSAAASTTAVAATLGGTVSSSVSATASTGSSSPTTASSASPSSASSGSQKSGKHLPVWAIVVIVIGAIALIALVGAAVFFAVKKFGGAFPYLCVSL